MAGGVPVKLRLESLLAVTGRRATLRTASVVTSHGLSAAGWWLLDELSSGDANGSVLVELARGGGFAPSTITAASDALSERGLVRRQRDRTDRRLVRLWIAPQGLQLVPRIRAEIDVEVQGLYALYDRAERRLLAALLSRIAQMGTPN